MEKGFRYFLLIAVIGLFVGILIAMSVSRPSMTMYEEAELSNTISNWNSDLPRNIGTIGTMDSIVYHERTIICNITVFGDNSIKEVYKQHYDEFKEILKYSLLTMNGQHNMGNMFSSVLDKKELYLGFRVYTQDGEATEWRMPGCELKEFMKTCQMSPTTALKTAIDMQIEIANIHLPIKVEDVRNPIKSVALNSILGHLDESCLPKAISHIGEDIIFEYNVSEDSIDIDGIDKIKDDSNAIELFASSLIEDEDVHEFLGIIAISHSNIVVTYEGRKTHKVVSIRIPYFVLKKYCKVPQYLLS
jgi:hypothetical protein